MEELDKKSGIKFDPTVNLGHILTFVGFILAILAAWQNLDKRLIILEENRNLQAQVDRSQDARLDDRTRHISEVLSEIKNSILRLEEKIDRQPNSRK